MSIQDALVQYATQHVGAVPNRIRMSAATRRAEFFYLAPIYNSMVNDPADPTKDNDVVIQGITVTVDESVPLYTWILE